MPKLSFFTQSIAMDIGTANTIIMQDKLGQTPSELYADIVERDFFNNIALESTPSSAQ